MSEVNVPVCTNIVCISTLRNGDHFIELVESEMPLVYCDKVCAEPAETDRLAVALIQASSPTPRDTAVLSDVSRALHAGGMTDVTCEEMIEIGLAMIRFGKETP